MPTCALMAAAAVGAAERQPRPRSTCSLPTHLPAPPRLSERAHAASRCRGGGRADMPRVTLFILAVCHASHPDGACARAAPLPRPSRPPPPPPGARPTYLACAARARVAAPRRTRRLPPRRRALPRGSRPLRPGASARLSPSAERRCVARCMAWRGLRGEEGHQGLRSCRGGRVRRRGLVRRLGARVSATVALSLACRVADSVADGQPLAPHAPHHQHRRCWCRCSRRLSTASCAWC